MEGWITSSPDDVRFWDGRQLLFGIGVHNFGVRKEKAFELLRVCRHNEARWFCALFPNGISAVKQVKKVLLKVTGERHAAALCYAGVIDPRELDLELVLRAANMGYSFAFAVLSFFKGSMEFAVRGAALGDRSCISCLWQFYQESDPKKASELKRRAVSMGDWYALESTAQNISPENPAHWRMSVKFAVYVWGYDDFMRAGLKMLEKYKLSMEDPSVVFAIGGCLKSMLHVEGIETGPFLELYEDMLAIVREEITCWTLCARKREVSKDVQYLISRVVWETRKEGRIVKR